VRVSTAEDWHEISRWYWNLCEPHLSKTNAALCAKAEEIGHFDDMLSPEKFGTVNAIVNTYDDAGNQSAKWAVFGYALYERVMSGIKRDQILNAVDYISGKTLPAVIKSHDQVSVIPRVDAAGKTVSVSIISISIGETGEQELLVRNPVGEKFAYMSAKKAYTETEYESREDGYLVKIPPLEPYEMITVFCG